MAQRGPHSRSTTPRRKSTESAEIAQPLKKRKKQAQVGLQEQCLTNPGDKLVISYSVPTEKLSSVPCFRKGHFPEAFLWPLTADDFVKKYYKQRVYTSHGGGIDRTRFLVEKHLSSLSLSSLLKRTPSPHIFVWMRNQSDGQIESFSIDDVKAALTLHNAGASLYFRAPQEMADQVVTELTDVLGLNFGGYFPNGDVKGEIETFVSKKGHVTDWHFDFQENFTVQLQGTKRWKLMRSGITHPIRGWPHYKTADNVEEQLKVHRMQDPHFKWRPASFEGAEEVVLRPGDCFYHPAGLWHRVECEEDAISINVSLISSTWADIAVDALRQLLWKSEDWRAAVQFSSPQAARAHMTHLLNDLKQRIGVIQADDLLPQSIFTPRETNVIVEWDPRADQTTFPHNKAVRSNPLAVLLRVDDLPAATKEEEEESEEWIAVDEEQEDENAEDESSSGYESESESVEEPEEQDEDGSERKGRRKGKGQGAGGKESEKEEGEQDAAACRFALHISFGNEELQSQVRVEFQVPHLLLPIWTAIAALLNEPTFTVSAVSTAAAAAGAVADSTLAARVAKSLRVLASHGALKIL